MAYTPPVGKCFDTSNAPDKVAEIPNGIDHVNSELNELQELLGMLHMRLEPVMPPCGPECSALSAVEAATTPLGQQLAEHARRVRQANSSVRNMLERIKL